MPHEVVVRPESVYKLKKRLRHLFPDAVHVSDFGMMESDDIQIWNFAKINSYTIVTSDADFFDILLVKGFPPKVIWIKKGNSSTISIYEAIHSKIEMILEFENNPASGCLEIY